MFQLFAVPAALTVTSGGTISVPAGSIASNALAASGVTAGNFTSANITVDAQGLVTAASNGSGGGGGSLTVEDGTTTVASVTTLKFTSGATVSTSGAGVADVAITGGGGGGGLPATSPDLVLWLQADQANISASTGVQGFQNYTPWLQDNLYPVNGPGVFRDPTQLNSLNVWTWPNSNVGRYALQSPLSLPRVTAFIVFKNNGAIGSSSGFNFAGGAGSFQFVQDGSNGKLAIVKAGIVVVAESTGVIASGSFTQGNCTYDEVSGAYSFRIAQAADSSGTNAQSITAATSGLGWNPANGGEDTNGSIAEFIVYQRVLTLTEIQSVESYLHSKWGV